MVYRPTARVLTVLELLQSHSSMTGPELARRLEVNVRTVRHYIEMLQDLGIPVEAERGRYGAYHLRPGYKLPPLIFTEEEAIVLTLSLLMARGGRTTMAPAVEGVLAKVERVLPDAVRTRVQAVQRTVAVRDESRRVTPSAATVTVLSEATQAGYRVRLHYRSARSEVTERAFDPYGVVSRDGIWYTIGYCHMRRGQRLFRLDRILHVAATGERFDRPADFDALAAVHRTLVSVPKAWRFAVWLETTLDEARQMRLSNVSLEEVDGGVVLRGEVEQLEWIAVRLAGLGMPLVILDPPELRAVLRDYALALAHDAQRTTS